MCGIAGLLHFDPARAVDPLLLDRMTDVLAHRGPDGRGTHIDGALGLGHRRLSIIDLSDDAAQPMPNEDGTVWVVLNGEIYNFQELRAECEARGHRFRCKSDTEVLVHLYEELGDAFVERLRGMFAFALWDARKRRLLLARDRLGKKPLYYRLTPGSLHFGSEIKAILEDPEVTRAPDELSIHNYLTYGYVPAPGTAFQGISKLPPAHVLTVEADGRSALRPYWALRLSPKEQDLDTPAAVARAEEKLIALLDEAVRLRMIADVPLGAFLSGGVDSSSVVASMCAVSGGRGVRTFSIGFDEPAYDERGYAERVARALGTEHEALVLTPDSFTDIERIAWHYGEPFADSSALPTFAVSALARRRVTVALSGDGGDELLVGYHRYVGTELEERIRRAPLPLRLAARSRYLIELMRRAGFQGTAGELAHNRYAQDLGASDLYLTRIEQISPALMDGLYAERLRSLTRAVRGGRELVRRAIARSDGETFTERCAHADAVTYLPDDILVKVDVASMAHGLECRAPLLDHHLAEFVGRLPFRLKMRGLETKWLLKHAMRRRLPREPLRRRKMGFGVPLDHWFRGRLDGLMRDVLLSPAARARGYFRPEAVERLIDEHAARRLNHQNALFTMLMLELWHRLWIDPPQGKSVPARAVAVAR